MKLTDTGLRFAPSDLSNHLGCRHLTLLDAEVAEGRRPKAVWENDSLEVMQERGRAFEQAYLQHLQKEGKVIQAPEEENGVVSREEVIDAMRRGVDYIYQARLGFDMWSGVADFLKRVDVPSDLGAWSYEVMDTKLARETRAGAILQLCVYAQALERIQGRLPDRIYIVSPDGEGFREKDYRTHDFMAYHRLLQRRMAEDVRDRPEPYPEPVAQCDICKWWKMCDTRRRADDHLSLVAGITRTQRAELTTWGVSRVDELASLPLPLERKPARGVPESYVKAREQARIQVQSRGKKIPLFEVLEQQPPFLEDGGKQVITMGLYRLPEPTPGDIFLDFEGDPFVGTSGIEYLFGWIEAGQAGSEYKHIWAFDPEAEKRAFESFIDRVMLRKEAFPNLHIYHFGHYEPSALKRMMGKYATRESEIDWLLRGQRFVDLHAIVKQVVRAGVEQYSLKSLEPIYGFSRQTDLRVAAVARRDLEHALELGRPGDIEEVDRHITLDYNREDCESAEALRDWLEGLRTDLINKGQVIDRPEPMSGDTTEGKQERDAQLKVLYDRLVDGLPADANLRTAGEQTRWLLANMLEYHWREEKSGWWEYYDLLKRPIDELVDARTAIGLLAFKGRFESQDDHVVNEYTFPPQDTEIKAPDLLYDQAGREIGRVTNIDAAAGILTLKQSLDMKDEHPEGLVRKPVQYDGGFGRPPARPAAIRRIAEWVAEYGADAEGSFRAVRDLLLRREPRPGSVEVPDGESKNKAVWWAGNLQESVLSIQGPPGAGKTYTGAAIIIDLVRKGKRVGVTANSHKVIDNLLEEVIKQAGKNPVLCGHYDSGSGGQRHPMIRQYRNGDQVVRHFQRGEVQVMGGTPIMWANQKYADLLDVLIVDEAGQLSLADTIAAGQAARNLVLLGDPQQLKQPQQGSHPEGTEVSALEHILGDHATIPADKGLFLDNTRRMHPNICTYISELFYENRLQAFPGLERQVLAGPTKYAVAGLWLEPVEHAGNQNASEEEAMRVADIFAELTSGSVTWTDMEEKVRPVGIEDVLIITPYNAQIARIRQKLPDKARVGTVDKFQGQEAPVVIYSMATSSPEDAPRGMDFLYSLNRLNVAVSRARCAVILVASPKLFRPECRTPAQMRMANAVCRYAEVAKRS